MVAKSLSFTEPKFLTWELPWYSLVNSSPHKGEAGLIDSLSCIFSFSYISGYGGLV